MPEMHAHISPSDTLWCFLKFKFASILLCFSNFQSRDLRTVYVEINFFFVLLNWDVAGKSKRWFILIWNCVLFHFCVQYYAAILIKYRKFKFVFFKISGTASNHLDFKSYLLLAAIQKLIQLTDKLSLLIRFADLFLDLRHSDATWIVFSSHAISKIFEHENSSTIHFLNLSECKKCNKNDFEGKKRICQSWSFVWKTMVGVG